ncbi:MAG: exo-alpha-sialidase [Opitutae bacterium]|nr:exo-alpha-sialidase [Opitutae bacterium]
MKISKFPDVFPAKIFSKLALVALCAACPFVASAPAFAAEIKASTDANVWPAMVRLDYNPIIKLTIDANAGDPLSSVTVDFAGTTKAADIESVEIFLGGKETESSGDKIGAAKVAGTKPILVQCKNKKLSDGENVLFVSVKLKANADITGTITANVPEVRIGTKKISTKGAKVTQRIGYAVAKADDLGSKFYRIPAIARSKKGSLVSVFDVRYNSAGDLPAKIDVGVSRTEDGGKTWTPAKVIMTSKGMEVDRGIGDPGILSDDDTGTLWVSGLWAPKSGHPIFSSSTGTTDVSNCGQMLLVKSDDDGKTWSKKPINITPSIKRLNDADTSSWGLVFQGPGAGICTKDGTLVFPAQVWGDKGKGTKGVLVYSKDHGKTWTSSKEMALGGSESTCVQLKNGSIMLNVRQGSPKNRVVATTKDMGETWNKSNGAALRQPGNLCQAALLISSDKRDLYFSNPNSGVRDNMTLKYSKDEGKSWTTGLTYESRLTAGYSSIAFADDKESRIGVLYEGVPKDKTICFLSIPTAEIQKANDKKAK